MLWTLQEDAELASRLVELRAYIDDLELEFSRLAADFEKTDTWDLQGSNSALDWIRFHCHMTSHAAADRIAVGKADLVESHQAMRSGDIGFAHLTVMARTARAVGEAFDESRLLDLARENSPGKFHYQSLHYRHSVNAPAYAGEQNELAESAYLHLNFQEDGCLSVVGLLDPVGGAALRNTLEPLARRAGPHDHRLRPKRLADALVEFAESKTLVQMQVTSSLETLLDLAGAAGAEQEFSLPISSKTAQRWACDCSVTRVLLQDSVVMDVGQSTRTIRGPRRRALVARDRHCQWPGCERPASSCDGHHIVFWMHGGGDELENMVLLCKRHHRLVHESGWRLVRTDQGKLVTIAPPTTFAMPRGPD